jgi:hypothetical protein
MSASTGGPFGPNFVQPAGNWPADTFPRPPDLGYAPAIVDFTGLGDGGGAGIVGNGADADCNSGAIAFNFGINPASSGTITIVWPPDAIVDYGSEPFNFFAPFLNFLMVVTQGNPVIIQWSIGSGNPPEPNRSWRIVYQWANQV